MPRQHEGHGEIMCTTQTQQFLSHQCQYKLVPAPGPVAQMRGLVWKQQDQYASIYIDQYLGLGFAYLQKATTTEDTLQGKHAFE